MKRLREILKIIFDAVFPPLCLNCSIILSEPERELSFCEGCLKKFSYISGFFCPACKKRLPGPETKCHQGEKFILASPFKFEDKIVQKIIHLLKYKRVKTAAKPLAFFMSQYLLKTLEKSPASAFSATIIPVPLHKSKERKRGFNQSLLISEWLVFYLKESDIFHDISMEKSMIIKSRKAPSQTEQKSYLSREENIKDSFRLTNKGKVSGENFIIVDDVFTSGSTTREIAKLLKINGAKKVWALTAART